MIPTLSSRVCLLCVSLMLAGQERDSQAQVGRRDMEAHHAAEVLVLCGVTVWCVTAGVAGREDASRVRCCDGGCAFRTGCRGGQGMEEFIT